MISERSAAHSPAIAIAAIVAVAVLSSVSIGCGSDKIEPGQLASPAGLPAPENLLTVERVRRPTQYEAVGTVRSRAQATVSSQVAGRIVAVKVEAGMLVEVGAQLAKIEELVFLARLEQARRGRRAAVAGRDQADTSYARIEKLSQVKAATQEQLEAALSGAKQATANVDAARQKLRQARIAHEHTRVTSPIGGVVEQRLVDPGDLALPGKPLFVIHHPEDLRLEASVREGVIDQIRMGQRVTVELVATAQTVTGTVSEIVPSADPVSRSFQVKVTLPPAEGVYPGMFGKLEIPIGERDAILVPSDAIIRVGQLTTVSARVGERWERRYVSIGEERDGQVEVLAGLSAGETIGWGSESQ
jgi:HlyD family secretion protein